MDKSLKKCLVPITVQIFFFFLPSIQNDHARLIECCNCVSQMSFTTHHLPPIAEMVPRHVLPVRCAGWAPHIDLPVVEGPYAPPHFKAFDQPKEMADPWRATKTHLLSSFCFNLTSVTCRELHRGVSTFKTSDWLGLDDHGMLKDQYALTQSLQSGEKLVTPENGSTNYWNHDGGGGGGWGRQEYTHRSTQYDTIVWGNLNDGASLAIHVTDFCPWIVYQFRNKKMPIHEIKAAMEKIKSAHPDELGKITYEIRARACSDGMLPSKRNPYNERKYNYVYIFTPDASFNARRTLSQAMESLQADAVEDDALNESVRFLQATQMCPTEWYTILNWSQVRYGFVTDVMIEIDCTMADIIAMINAPQGIVLPPHTEVYWDIEHHKFETGAEEASSKRGFATADDILNNIICINVAVWRTGAFDAIEPDDPCRQNMPRMEDEPINLLSYMDANNMNGDDELADIPDPLEVEQSKSGNRSAHNPEIAPDQAAAFGDGPIAEGGVIESDNMFDAAMNTDILPIIGEVVPEDCDLEDLIRGLGTQVNIGNLDNQDLDHLDDIQAVVDTLQTDKNASYGIINPDVPLKGTFMDVDAQPLVADVAREPQQSRDARHGYEIPKWASSKLGARIDLMLKNLSLPELKRIQTPIILQNSKYIRRISFFVDPELDRPFRKIIIKPLYKDGGDGILVHAFRSEASAIVAFRDFMVAVHPDMTCGHFTRSYDWKTLITRANCTLGDTIPAKNTTRDFPFTPDKLMRNLPILEYKDMLSTPDSPFPVAQKQYYYDALSNGDAHIPFHIKQDAKERQSEGRAFAKKSSRTSCFAFMNRLIFCPIQVTRKITRSSNTASVESLCPNFDGFADIDSLVCVRLALATLPKFSLNYLSEMFLKDAKMDIGIPRMNACYRQKQYWPIIAYCDYDCVLVGALMSALSLRMAHAALSRCCHLSMHEIPNFGQQRRIFVKNALIAHVTDMVLVRCGIVSPQVFGGGHVETPNGGIYPVPCDCLDYVSFYVTLMMEHNFCFTAFQIPWDHNFEQIIFDPFDPIAALKAFRTFQRNQRRVYGPPDYRKRPNAMPYYTCLKCHCENFFLVPTSITFAELADLPTHEMLNADKTLAAKYKRCVPSECPSCLNKPWLSVVEDQYDTSKVPDCTSALDPYREQRYAADFDYLVPRMSMVSFQSDPEAFEMHELKRYKPGSDTEFVREDMLVEHEWFDWIDDEQWAKQRHLKGFAAFKKSLAEKKSKKRDMSNVRYVPSLAGFVLWRPGDFDNQAKKIYIQQKMASGTYDPNSMPVDEAEQDMLETIGSQVWTVDTFEAYANATARKADIERIKAFESRQPFDRTRFDIRSRRGIVKYGSTTGAVQKLFRSRKATTSLQAQMKKNALWYDEKSEKWLSGVKKTQYEGYNAEQLGKKGSANSAFGATGTQTGSIKNTFVAAAITFMSRNMIYFTTYVTLTRWCPTDEVYQRICKYREIILRGRDQVTGVMQKYMERFVDRAPWPKTPEAGRQVWLKPICSAYQVRYDLVECLWGIFNAYGDTDSIFPCLAGLVLGDPEHPIHELDTPRRQLAIDIGKSMAGFVTTHFRMCALRWVAIEFEKMMYPFNLFDKVKKRYIGGNWEKAEVRKQITKRSWGIKRDMPKNQQRFIQSLIEVLVATMSGETLDALFRAHWLKMMERGGVIEDFERDVAEYSKSQAFNKSEYASVTCHVAANERLAAAFPGHEYALGDRIEYVICYDPTEPEIAHRSWTLTQIRLMMEERDAAIKMGLPPPKQISELRIDVPYYVGQYLSTLSDVYTITKPGRQVYDRQCSFASPDSALQRLFAAGKWNNMILAGASMEEHLQHYEQVAQKDNSVEMLALTLQDVSLCNVSQGAGSTRLNQNVMAKLMDSGGVVTSSDKTKKKSPLAKLIVDKYVAMARTCVSQTLSSTTIGIHSFFGNNGQHQEDTDRLMREFDAQREAQRASAEAAASKKRTLERDAASEATRRKATKYAEKQQPKSSNSLITSFFRK